MHPKPQWKMWTDWVLVLWRKAAVEGDTKNGCFLAGQISGMLQKQQPAAEIVKEVAEKAEELLKGAAKWVK